VLVPQRHGEAHPCALWQTPASHASGLPRNYARPCLASLVTAHPNPYSSIGLNRVAAAVAAAGSWALLNKKPISILSRLLRLI